MFQIGNQRPSSRAAARVERLEERRLLSGVPTQVLSHGVNELSVARANPVALTVGNTVIVGCGQDPNHDPQSTVDLYDATTGQWSSQSAPWSAFQPTIGAAGPDLAVFTDGGQLEMYTPSSGSWLTTNFVPSLPDLKVAVQSFSVLFVSDDTVHIFDRQAHTFGTQTLSGTAAQGSVVINAGDETLIAGEQVAGQPSDVVDVYTDDPTTPTWTVTHMTRADDVAAATVVGDLAFFASADGDVNVYDASTDQWSTTPAMPLPANAGPVLTANTLLGRAVFAGSNFVDIYDPSTSQWSMTPIGPRSFTDPQTAIVGDKYFYFGGVPTGGAAATDLAYVYDGSAGTWSIVRLAAARGSMGIATVGDQLIVAGGGSWTVGNDAVPPTTVDVFSSIAPAPHIHGWFTRAVLPRELHPGQTGSATFVIRNTGHVATVPPYYVSVWALAGRDIAGAPSFSLGSVRYTQAITANGGLQLTLPLSIPDGLTPTAGQYHLALVMSGRRGSYTILAWQRQTFTVSPTPAQSRPQAEPAVAAETPMDRLELEDDLATEPAWSL